MRYELAGNHSRDWSVEARRLLGVPAMARRRRLDRISRSGAPRVSRRLVRRRPARRLHLFRPPAGVARARVARAHVRAAQARCGCARQPDGGPRARRRGPGRARVFVLRRGVAIRSRPARASSARRRRPSRSASAEVRHELRVVCAGDPGRSFARPPSRQPSGRSPRVKLKVARPTRRHAGIREAASAVAAGGRA